MNNSPLIQVFAPSGTAPNQCLPIKGVEDPFTDPPYAYLQVALVAQDSGGNPLPLFAYGNDVDSMATQSDGILGVVGFNAWFSVTGWNRAREASYQNMGNQTARGAGLMSAPGEWAIRHQPAAATQATITRAAGGLNVRHVCRSITVTLLGVAAQAPIEIFLRDGATGVGTILWSARLQCLAGDAQHIALSDLNIVGSSNTAMTLEFGAAPAATNFASVALTGFDAN